MVSSKTPSPSAWRATGESGSRSRRRNVAFGPFKRCPPSLLPGEQHSGWVSLQHPPRNATPMPGVRIDKTNTYPSDARQLGALGPDGAGQHGGTRVSSGLLHFRKAPSALDAAQHAQARRRASLDAAPAAKPEVRALDEAIQHGRQLRTALRLDELERDVVAVEHRIRRAQDAGAGVALERVDPCRVGRAIHPEADEDAMV